MDKQIHDIFSIGSKVNINGQNGIADGMMVLGSSEKMYSVLDIISEDDGKIILGADIETKVLFSLSQEQYQLYLENVKLHKKRLVNGNTEKILNYKFNDCNYACEETINKIIMQDNVKSLSAKISVSGKDYSIIWYSLMCNRQGDSLVVAVSEEEMMSGLATHPLYNDIDFSISFPEYDLKHRGNIVRIEKANSSYLLYIHGYPIEVLQSTQGSGTVFKNIVNPFSVMDFVVNHADSDVSGIVYPHSEEKPVHNYIVVGVLRNIDVEFEDCAIGDVRIGTQIDASEEFKNAILNVGVDNYTLIWVNVYADSLYSAFSKGKKLLNGATEFLSFILKNDMYSDWFGTLDAKNEIWDVRSHYPQISLSKVFYIENCIMGESITITDENIRIPSGIKLDENSEYLFECDWIESFFKNLEKEDEKTLRLRYALKWISEAWGTEDSYDKVIYCSMALEFIVNGEKGSNIFDEHAIKNGLQKLSKRKRRELIDDIYEKAKIENIEGFTEEAMLELNKSIKNMIQNKLSESSFGTKLDNLICRLEIPISEEEKELLKKARGIRNELIHGINMSTISTLEIKKLSGITSRVLMYKLIDSLKKEK